MKKNDFILTVLANNLNVFTNESALKANVKDMIRIAELMFDLADQELESRKPISPSKSSKNC